MKINILTLFPEMFTAVTGSILGRAAEKGLLKFNFVNIRDFSQDKHKKVDDYPFGGGQGMVMMADPVFRALESVEAKGKNSSICLQGDGFWIKIKFRRCLQRKKSPYSVVTMRV